METDKKCHTANLEIWGGIESTINRVHHQYFDQLHFSDHYNRKSDIDLIAGLGIKKLRYPILWEKHQPAIDTKIDFSWVQERLEAIRDAGITPIAGLLHHGSGPVFTNMMDEKFPYLFADYARKVAHQLPWITEYTPVNEPLTTARFSGLYGLWYPHHKLHHSFLRMLMNETKATILAMKAIRKIQPDAKLIQTEDLGKTYSTPLLAYQARFENKRRWLSIDLLCGKIDERHKLWRYFLKNKITEEELLFFKENACPPDVLGWNYYVTSERYLDENLTRYPVAAHGGNKKHAYADVEAVRVALNEPSGLKVLLTEAEERYHLPTAITEVHLHCTREEQLRWFEHIYKTCSELNSAGFNIKAITAWSLFGAYGWSKLLTAGRGEYEPGAFDLRSGIPRETALARFIKSKNQQSDFHPSLLCYDGWWHTEHRLKFGYKHPQKLNGHTRNSRPLVIIGKRGTLGSAFARICKLRNIHTVLLSRQDCDITSLQSIQKVIKELNPWGVINAAGYVKVDEAETDEYACFNANVTGPQQLAQVCMQHNIPFLSFSSDLVFDGHKNAPYVESDQVNPMNVYGRSKAESERVIFETNPSSLVIRTSAFFGPWDEYNFAYHVIKSLESGRSIPVMSDVYVSPTYVPDLVRHSLDLLIDNENGIWHLANQGSVTWADFAEMIAKEFHLDTGYLQYLDLKDMQLPAPRPRYTVLGSEKGEFLPSLENAIERYAQAIHSPGVIV
ncbi:MAG: dTDP-4-dehydrorhamnose reductase [Chitinophagaceae bacterium]|nr:dTDP-4-dehydrorhamnose reductase [Chitinophagaceae bacterium]